MTPDLEARDAIDDSGSLSDHEATWNRKRGDTPLPPATPTEPPSVDLDSDAKEVAEAAREEATDPSLRYRPKEKHRAQKDKARPEDVPRIKELSGKLKDLEKERDEWKTKWETAQTRPTESAAPARIETPAAVSEKFTFAAFDKWLEANPTGDYDAWQDAKLDARDTWRDQQQHARTVKQQEDARAQQTQTQAQQFYQQATQKYQERRVAYEQAHPDRVAAFQPAAVGALDQRLPGPAKPLIEATIMLAENGPDLLYTLQQRPDLLAELALFSDGKPATEQYVAMATQWLQARVQPGTTAAGAALKAHKSPPKPPTAVRTGPMTTGTEPPGDGASLADHEAFYTKKRR